MSFMNWIVQRLRDTSDWFYAIFLEVRSWIYPFYLAADFFYELCWLFYYLANNFSDFGDWVDYVITQLSEFFTELDLEQWFKDWKNKILDTWDWVRSAWDNIWNEVEDWWTTVKPVVLGWISIAEDWLSDWINAIERGLASLQTAWDEWKAKIPSFNEIWAWFTNWWGSVLANIIAWGALTVSQIDTLIDSRIKEWLPLFEGWLDWKDKIIEFFTDPEEWLYKALDRIIERFW